MQCNEEDYVEQHLYVLLFLEIVISMPNAIDSLRSSDDFSHGFILCCRNSNLL